MASAGKNSDTELCGVGGKQENAKNCIDDCNALAKQATQAKKNEALQEQSETGKSPMLVNYAPPSISNLHCEPTKDSKKSVYKTDFEKKNFLIMPYRKLLASFDTPLCALIGGKSAGSLKYSSYRDATNFKQFLFEGKGAKTAGPITTSLEKYQSWSGPFASVSEYMDTISKNGLNNMKNQQQYLEPLTPSQGKFADRKL